MRSAPHLHRLTAGLVGLSLTGGLLGLSTTGSEADAALRAVAPPTAGAPAELAQVDLDDVAPAPTEVPVGPAPTTTATPPPASTAPPQPSAPPPAPAPSSTAPAPPTTTSPPPAPAPPAPSPPSPAPAPAPEGGAARTPPPAPSPPPTTAPAETRLERVQRAYAAGVPADWRGAIDVRFEIIDGEWSWAHTNGLIQVAASHADNPFESLVDLVAHEFGHLIAFRYGTREYPGAPPEGWPTTAERPEEAWADCVQRAFTGRANATHGQAPCDGEPLRWAASWLAQGPGAHTRT